MVGHKYYFSDSIGPFCYFACAATASQLAIVLSGEFRGICVGFGHGDLGTA
jgi:hypothetical protein